MQLAFYHGNGDLITDLIRVLTWGAYSHVEIVFSDGRWFSASGRGNAGVRWKDGPGGEGWVLVDLPFITQEAEAEVFDWANRQIGLPFSWFGVWSFVVPWMGTSSGDWFCSELVVYALQRCVGLLPTIPLRTSPSRLYELVSDSRCPKPFRSSCRLLSLVGASALVGLCLFHVPRLWRRITTDRRQTA
jgi:hypothetical protein